MAPPPPPPPPPKLPSNDVVPAKNTISSGGGADRNDLFKQINKGGFKLKKTVTVDKSGPLIAGKINNTNNTTNNNVNKIGATRSTTNSQPNGVINFAEIFAGGRPNLKPTRTSSGSTSTPSVTPTVSTSTIRQQDSTTLINTNQIGVSNNIKSKETISNFLRKHQVPAATRGPPPQPPINQPSAFASTSKTTIGNEKQPINVLSSSNKLISELSNQVSINKSTDNVDSSSVPAKLNQIGLKPVANRSSLHGSTQITKPVISHGKPNVAPKPPQLKLSPSAKPNTTLSSVGGVNSNENKISRTQSYRMPRSPPVVSPGANQFSMTLHGNNNDFNTLRNVSTLHQSHEMLNKRSNPVTPTRNISLPGNQPPLRPTQPPPLRPPQTKPPPPPRINNININNNNNNHHQSSIAPPHSPPPPPPPSTVVAQRTPQTQQQQQQTTTHIRTAPPPPPPHNRKLTQQISFNNNGAPPTPPVRDSSMRQKMIDQQSSQVMISPLAARTELDSRYIFHPVSDFPRPDLFTNKPKEYIGAETGASVSKHKAPLPPNTTHQLKLDDKYFSSGNTSQC